MVMASIVRGIITETVVLSESPCVPIFNNGEMVHEIISEPWILNRYGHHLPDTYSENDDHDLTIVSKKK